MSMFMPSIIEDVVINKARKLEGDFEAIKELYPDVFTHCGPLEWNTRFRGGVIGRCWSKRSLGCRPVRIEIGVTYLLNNSYEDLLEILLHEAAHGIANRRAGHMVSHGDYFRMVCNEIGCKSPYACAHKHFSVAGPRDTRMIAQAIRRTK